MDPSFLNIIECPHCHDLIIIEKINCGIFRHGVYKKNGLQINPHLNMKECNQIFEEKLIYGCGKPFQINLNENQTLKIIICDYI